MLEDSQMLRGAVHAGGQTLSFGPLIAGATAEWAFDEARVRELRQASLASGCCERLDLSQAWRNPRVPRFTDLRDWLLAAALLILLGRKLIRHDGRIILPLDSIIPPDVRMNLHLGNMNPAHGKTILSSCRLNLPFGRMVSPSCGIVLEDDRMVLPNGRMTREDGEMNRENVRMNR